MQSVLKEIRKIMYTPTSKNELLHLLDNKVNIVLYNEISNYKTLDELLLPFYCCLILYPNFGQTDVGHWCCLFCNSDGTYLEFFDSYGAYIDNKIKEYDDQVDDHFDDGPFHTPRKIEPVLLDLILASRFKRIHYNDIPYQNNQVDTATCGLWCLIRLKNKHVDENTFKKIFLDIPTAKNVDPDLVISKIVYDLYPEMQVA